MDTEEISQLITNILCSIIIYALVLLLNLNHNVANSILAILIMSSFYKLKSLNFLFKKTVTPVPSSKTKLVNTIASLESYEPLTLKWNDRRRLNLKRLTSEQRRIAVKTSYNSRLDDVDQAIKANSRLVKSVARAMRALHDVDDKQMRLAVPLEPNYRVIEALCHLQRNWSKKGDEEINPILDYILGQLDHLKLDKENTTVVLPGSGLGRVAHEIALKGYKSVEAVEYSALMNAFNEFIYTEENNGQILYPYIHSHSHHVSSKHQLRKVNIYGRQAKPENLKLLNADLRSYMPSECENIVLVTEFFVDTAENVLEYMDAFRRISRTGENAYWINLGPLKYGSAPKFEPTLEEWREIRALYGWKDLNEIDPIEGGLVGYLTDEKSMWQGNYGVARWTSKIDQ